MAGTTDVSRATVGRLFFPVILFLDGSAVVSLRPLSVAYPAPGMLTIRGDAVHCMNIWWSFIVRAWCHSAVKELMKLQKPIQVAREVKVEDRKEKEGEERMLEQNCKT
jgi:hypothetical protein